MQARKAALDLLVHEARNSSPNECCGMLVGRRDEIVEAVRARNVASRPSTRFVIDPADHFAARRNARQRGLEVVGFYHSHPTSPPEPSARDLAEFSYPGHLYVIVSLAAEPAEIRLYRFAAGNFHPVPFATVR